MTEADFRRRKTPILQRRFDRRCSTCARFPWRLLLLQDSRHARVRSSRVVSWWPLDFEPAVGFWRNPSPAPALVPWFDIVFHEYKIPRAAVVAGSSLVTIVLRFSFQLRSRHSRLHCYLCHAPLKLAGKKCNYNFRRGEQRSDALCQVAGSLRSGRALSDA